MLNFKPVAFKYIILSFGIGTASVAQADLVLLQNGDRISGEIVELTRKSLTIKTSYAGTLRLDTESIHSFRTDSPQVWQVNLKPRRIRVLEAAHAGQVLVNRELLRIADLSLLPSQKEWKISGLLESTLDIDNDQNRKEKIHVNTELNLESNHWRHALKAESKRDKERARVTEDTIEANYTLDYLFDNHWFWRADSTYREEGVTTLNRYWYLGTGPGYRLWGEGKDKLDATFAYNRLWLNSGPLDWELGAWASALNYKQFWLDEKLETFSDVHISVPTIDGIDYIANTTSGVRYYFKYNIHVSLKYDYNETRLIVGTFKDSSYVLGAGANF